MQHARRRATLTVSAGTIAALSLVGCTSGEGGDSQEESNTLTVSWISNEAPGIQAVIDGFEAKNPGVTVNLTTADTAPYQAALRTQLSSGTATDVVWVWPANGNAGAIEQIAGADYFEDLSDQPWVTGYEPFIKDLVSIDDKTLVMAPGAGSFLPIFNGAALDASNLEAPTTLEELLQFCSDAKAQGAIPFVMPGAELYGPMALFFNLVGDQVYSDGVQFDDDLLEGKTTYADSGYMTAAAQFEQLRDSDCYQENAIGTNYEDAMNLLASGDAIMTVMNSTRLTPLRALAPDADFTFGAIDFSNGENADTTPLSTNGGAAIPSKGSNKQLALEFVEYLGAHTADYVEAIPGTIPTITENFTPADKNQQFLVDVMRNGNGMHFLSARWPSPEPESEMVNGLQGILLETETPEGLLEKMQAAFDAGL